MKFSTTAGALHDAISVARHAVPANAKIEHSGVLLSRKNGQLQVIGSNGDLTISAMVEHDSGTDGQVLLPPKPISGYLSSLAVDMPITVAAGDIEVELRAGNRPPYRFRPVKATVAAPAPVRADPAAVQFGRLADALAVVRTALDKDSVGVQLVSSPAGLKVNTTNGVRLAQAHLPEAGFGEFSGVLPIQVLDQVVRSEITHVHVDKQGRWLRFTGPTVSITTRLNVTVYPDVDTVLEQIPINHVSFAAQDLRDALAPLASIVEQKPLLCTIDQDQLLLHVDNEDAGKGGEEVSLLDAVSVRFKFAIKHNFLAEAISRCEKVTLYWSAPNLPLFLTSDTPVKTSQVIMPLQIGPGQE